MVVLELPPTPQLPTNTTTSDNAAALSSSAHISIDIPGSGGNMGAPSSSSIGHRVKSGDVDIVTIAALGG